MHLTPIVQSLLWSFLSICVYGYFGFLYSPWINFIILFILVSTIAIYITLIREPDNDVMASFVIVGRGHYLGDSTKKTPPTFQNCIGYIRKMPSMEAMEELVVKKLLKYDRLRKVVIPTDDSSALQSPVWCTRFRDAGGDIDVKKELIHTHHVKNNEELYTLIDQIGNTYIELDKPQWRFHLIYNEKATAAESLSEKTSGLNGDDSEEKKENVEYHAFIWRVSHGISDGLRLVAITEELCTNSKGEPIKPPEIGKLKRVSKKSRSSKSNINASDTNMASPPISSFPKWNTWKFWKQLFQDIQAVNYMSNGAFDTTCAWKPDQDLYLGLNQRALRTRFPIPFSYVSFLKKHYNVTVNDILTAAFAGSVRHYIETIDPKFFESINPKDFQSRALVPVGFPDKREFSHQRDWLRNDFSFVSWPIPVEIKSFQERVKVSNENANALKKSMQPILLSWPTQVAVRLGFFDTFIEKTVTNGFRRHSCVFSNIPSFNEPIFFAGIEIERLEANYYNTIPQILLVSYNGFVNGTLVVDPDRFPKANLILDYLSREIIQEYFNLNKNDKIAEKKLAEMMEK